jgi:hypothetical protein
MFLIRNFFELLGEEICSETISFTGAFYLIAFIAWVEQATEIFLFMRGIFFRRFLITKESNDKDLKGEESAYPF